MHPVAIVTIAAAVLLSAGIVVWTKRKALREHVENHSVTPDMLHSLLSSDQGVLVFDVRLPLDLLAYPEIIPGAQRVAPEDVIAKPSLIPADKDAVVYCTCPDDKTSRAVMQRAQALQMLRVKFLKGGLAEWKARGYPVEPYREAFHLYAGAPSK